MWPASLSLRRNIFQGPRRGRGSRARYLGVYARRQQAPCAGGTHLDTVPGQTTQSWSSDLRPPRLARVLTRPFNTGPAGLEPRPERLSNPFLPIITSTTINLIASRSGQDPAVPMRRRFSSPGFRLRARKPIVRDRRLVMQAAQTKRASWTSRMGEDAGASQEV